MRLTPNQALNHIKESAIQYLETVYKIAHLEVFAERGYMLRHPGTVAQDPFIEATPAFPTAHKLCDLEHAHSNIIPEGLSELVQHGVPVDRFGLYVHQEEALLAAFSDHPNLLVATGTGSGKTEAFLLPILADLLHEALTWPAAERDAERGNYDTANNVWLHSRRRETRPAALRAIILYPMNALVNDQLSRLRRILARGASPDWQRNHLKGNVIRFGMYTSLTQPTGSWTEKGKRGHFTQFMKGIEEDWEKLRVDLQDTGFWPRPHSPEMLCRWDMQMAPPDILVTNYSMLEYMLVRPIEAPMFEKTRQWLEITPDARLTLVLDEAHTYTGARGTEVAHLVRRLKERLAIESGSKKLRAIATSASIPTGSEKQIREFVSDLFGEPLDRFSLIRLGSTSKMITHRNPAESALRAFSKFYEMFNLQDPWPAIEGLAKDMNLGNVDRTIEAQISLYSLLEKSEEVIWVRERTARNATLLSRLAEECWGDIGTLADKEQATAGILAAGSYARPTEHQDTPPLLSMRVHAFFRGIPGIWACMNPDCPEVEPEFRKAKSPRPVGKLYSEPRPWCGPKCGARVLELFSCRHCGLLFLGGIPDQNEGSLWPWSDDLSGERQDLKSFQVFCVERPHDEANPEHRSMRTTLNVHPGNPDARVVYEVEPAEDKEGQNVSPFPEQCPRCQNYRAPGEDGREVIEPLRTRGTRTFSIIVEDGFRVQPRAAKGVMPNYGRKSLLFTDSRNEAAQLAADLRRDHSNDLFRQLVYSLLFNCPGCKGKGQVEKQGKFLIGVDLKTERRLCAICGGSGRIKNPKPVKFEDLRRCLLELELDLGIDPTYGKLENFFTQYNNNAAIAMREAEWAFNAALRRELSEDEFALEPLGLAMWRVTLPEQTGQFEGLTEEETKLFLQCVTRVLCTENILLPPQPYKPWEWPGDLVKPFERNRLFWGYKRVGTDGIPYNLTKRRKLGRFVIAVSQALIEDSRLRDARAAVEWVKNLQSHCFQALVGFQILQFAGAKIDNQVPYGIRIDSFELHPIGEAIHRCSACGYAMSNTLFNICLRCGQRTDIVSTQDFRNFYRRAAFYALPESEFDDPHPLRAIEHTAQISGGEARNIERWFQDFFYNDQNPLDFRVDVLSVTTTMEMGIDIGSLLSVGLRNVPPNVANYQQRAGRAGRRGSALATVLTYSQFRSHDQYYFHHPPEIVSNPPRVPTLYMQNAVIAHRHVRSLILQSFFYHITGGMQAKGLLGSWGTVADFANREWADKLRHYLAANRSSLISRSAKIVHPDFQNTLGDWLDILPNEIQFAVIRRDGNEEMLEILISAGLLPKYAFPVDVVSLNIPSLGNQFRSDDRNEDAMQRDLNIALSEYAPESEVIRGEFPKTYIYKSAGIYDPFEKNPNYQPTGNLIECGDCQSVTLHKPDEEIPDQCQECKSFNVVALPYFRPPGFTVDGALPGAGRVEYEGGGRERAGYTLPAKLLVGQTSFNIGKPQTSFAPRLYTLVREGELFIANKGPNRAFPGFLICPSCGRAITEETNGRHRYPADIPPNRGITKGPRHGDICPKQANFKQVILGYPFHSEVILLGVDLPSNLDAPYSEPSGRAIWYSFGTLVANAAAIELQIDPGELKVGVRAIRRNRNNLHGEVFIYDDVPGGAGYARSMGQNLKTILEKALELGEHCGNPDCAGACYHCLYDYRNQTLHPLLDRELGTALLSFILKGQMPKLDPIRVKIGVDALAEYARVRWNIKPGFSAGTIHIAQVLEDQHVQNQQIGVCVIHPLQSRLDPAERHAILAQYGVRCAVHTLFDLERRPFWVINNLL